MSLSFLAGRSLLDPLEAELIANVEVIVTPFRLGHEEAGVGVGGDVEIFVVFAGPQS